MPRLADQFVVLYGDVFVDFDFRELIDSHRSDAAATLLVRQSDHPWDSDLVVADEASRVTGFIGAGEHRDYAKNIANAAIYVVCRDVLSLVPEGKAADWIKDVFPAAVRRGLELRVHPYSGRGFIKDMGTPQRLDAVRAYLDDRNFVERAAARRLPVRHVFLDRDGVINRDVDLLSHPDQVTLCDGAADAIRRLNSHGGKVIVVTNQPVVARGLCSEETLRKIHRRLEELLARSGARLDAIYYCPHHPETHHRDELSVKALRVACSCRKPAPGMIIRAARDLGVDLAESVLVGDRASDIEAARRAGIRSILVGSADCGGQAPDSLKSDLAAAVDAIVAGELDSPP